MTTGPGGGATVGGTVVAVARPGLAAGLSERPFSSTYLPGRKQTKPGSGKGSAG